jgi:chromosome partitioning protein
MWNPSAEVVVQVISFMNMKGGVGKTTLAVNVAYALADLHQKKVLIVDGDPQFNATQCLLFPDRYLKHINDPTKGTLKEIFVPRSPGQVSTTAGIAKPVTRAKMVLNDCTLPIFVAQGKGRLDLLPSRLSLVEVQHSRRQTEARLKMYLEEKAAHYDYVLIDCPPTISIFTEAAILASDKYLVPIKPDPLSVVGLPLLEQYIEEYCTDFGSQIKQMGIVFTMVRGHTPQAMKDVMSDLRASRKDAIFPVWLNEATSVAESVQARQPVFRYAKATPKVKMQVVDIANEFLLRTSK